MLFIKIQNRYAKIRPLKKNGCNRRVYFLTSITFVFMPNTFSLSFPLTEAVSCFSSDIQIRLVLNRQHLTLYQLVYENLPARSSKRGHRSLKRDLWTFCGILTLIILDVVGDSNENCIKLLVYLTVKSPGSSGGQSFRDP